MNTSGALGTTCADDVPTGVSGNTDGSGLCSGLGAGTAVLLLPFSRYCTVTLTTF